MKKIIYLFFIVLIITSCSTGADIIETKKVNTDSEIETYVVGGKQNNYINIYGNILNNNIKDLSSNIGGKITYLSCESGQKVNYNTLIAKIEPNSDGLSYKNNRIQLNSLEDQLENQKEIKESTILNFESKVKQLNLAKVDLENQIKTIENSIGNELSENNKGIEKQGELLNESEDLLIKSKEQTLIEIESNIENLKGSTYNTISESIKKLDEVFSISKENKDTNKKYGNFLGAKDKNQKSDVEARLTKIINTGYLNKEELSKLTNIELSNSLEDFSILLKDASSVMESSISSEPDFTQSKIDGLYSAFLGYSNGIIKIKTSLDSLINGKETAILTFDNQIKALSQSRESLDMQKNSLSGGIDSLNIALENIDEQLKDLLDTKDSTLNQLDIQIINTNSAIDRLNIMFQTNLIYAEESGVVKQKNVKLNNLVQMGTPICTIVPNNNSVKLEVYSPENLKIGDKFNYFYEQELLGTGTIISEYPVKNNLTQNYTYKGNIDFGDLKEGDYLDIKVIKEKLVNSDNKSIWIPINMVKPKLDGFYVNKIMSGSIIEEIKVVVGNMNNGEIMIKSGLTKGDILKNN